MKNLGTTFSTPFISADAMYVLCGVTALAWLTNATMSPLTGAHGGQDPLPAAGQVVDVEAVADSGAGGFPGKAWDGQKWVSG